MTSARLRLPRRPRDSFAALQLRRLATGFGWAVFGLGGLVLSLTWFRWLCWSEPDGQKRMLRARRTIGASFRLYLRLLRRLRVLDLDTSALRARPPSRGSVIVSNHPTLLDYVFITSEMPETDCIVKEALAHNFFLKGVVRAAGYLYNSEDPERLLQECEERLRAGGTILVFPEGTRTRPGAVMKFRRGAAQIALRSGGLIEAINIQCSESWLAKGEPWYRIPSSRPVIRLVPAGTIDPRRFWDGSPGSIPAAARALTRETARRLS